MPIVACSQASPTQTDAGDDAATNDVAVAPDAGPDLVTLASNQAIPQALALGGGNVFWLNAGNGYPNNAALMSCAAGGCNDTTTLLVDDHGLAGPLNLVMPPLDQVGPLAADAQHVLVLERGRGGLASHVVRGDGLQQHPDHPHDHRAAFSVVGDRRHQRLLGGERQRAGVPTRRLQWSAGDARDLQPPACWLCRRQRGQHLLVHLRPNDQHGRPLDVLHQWMWLAHGHRGRTAATRGARDRWFEPLLDRRRRVGGLEIHPQCAAARDRRGGVPDAASRPRLSASRPRPSASRPTLSASQPGLSASQPGLSASRPGLSASQN